MQNRDLSPLEFLGRASERCSGVRSPVLIDLRNPAEFRKGHLPAAVNYPLIGGPHTWDLQHFYQLVGPDNVVETALEAGAATFQAILDEWQAVCAIKGGAEAAQRSILLYCSVGGLLSQCLGALLLRHGWDVHMLRGGYKAFRKWSFDELAVRRKVCTVGGPTGSGKTEVLVELRNMGRQVLDLEALARHKGSVFGHLGEGPQPTSEQFQNLVAIAWIHLDPNCFVFIEDEGPTIGDVYVPAPLYRHMREGLVICLDVPFELRAQRSLAVYGGFSTEELREIVSYFREQMGDARTEELLDCLSRGELLPVCETALRNYDKSYEHHLHKGRNSEAIIHVPVSSLNCHVAASALLAAAEGYREP